MNYKKELLQLIKERPNAWMKVLYSTHKFIYDDIIKTVDKKFIGCKISTLVYCYLNDITEFPKCDICNKQIINLKTDIHNGFRHTCDNPVCQNKYKHEQTKKAIFKKYGTEKISSLEFVKQKVKQTKKIRYGSENYNNIAKAKKTCLKKYGVDNPGKADPIKEKMKKTCLEKYGTEFAFQSEDVKNKIKQTSLEKYGIANPGWSNIAQEKIKKTCQEKYGVDTPGHLFRREEYRQKVIDTCQKKYGVDYPCQSEIAKIKNRETNLKKYGCSNHSVLDSYEKMSMSQIDIPVFTLEEFDNNETRILPFKCLKCGKVFTAKHENGRHHLCPWCFPFFGGISHEEVEVFDFIKQIYSGEIIQNTQKIISPYELDIYIPEKKLAFEFDGLYWHCDENKPNGYHLEKTKLCEKLGIQLIHIFENEWIYKKEIVKSRLKNLLGIYDKNIYARNCNIKNISIEDSINFLKLNHIQGEIISKVSVGLYYENELVSIMTFGKSRFSKKYEWELLRFCNKLGYHIPGAASKLLTYFEKNYKPKNLVSYADRRWSIGNVYKKLGFKFDHNSRPDYWYFKNGVFVLESRVKYQKHRLSKLLESFDVNKTEIENMKENGYHRIFDCGNLTFVKEY